MGRMQEWLFEFSPALNSHLPAITIQFLVGVLLILAFSTSWSFGSAELATWINRACLQQSICSTCSEPKTKTSCQHHFKHELWKNTQETESETLWLNLWVPLIFGWWNFPLPLAKSPGKISGKLPRVAQWPTQLPRHQRQLLVVSEWGNQWFGIPPF